MGKRWKKFEDEYLRCNGSLSYKELSEYLDRSESSVRNRFDTLSIPRLVYCIDCNKLVNRNGSSKYCDKCRPDARGIKNAYKNNPLNKYRSYMNSAEHRDIVFKASLEEFLEYWQEPCFYCGDEIETIGVDRVDNSIGYEVGNLVSCCTKCNYMKKHYSTEDWVTHMRKVLNNLEGPG